jgi:hypothetical protein
MRLASFVLALALAPLAAQAADGPRTFGQPLTGRKATPLADVLAAPKDGQPVCLEGTVSAVCQNKGCWMELQQAGQAVHVTFEGYSFFVPKDSAGKAVKLEGRLLVQQPKPDEVEHMQAEGAGAAAASKVQVVATGVELR